MPYLELPAVDVPPIGCPPVRMRRCVRRWRWLGGPAGR